MEFLFAYDNNIRNMQFLYVVIGITATSAVDKRLLSRCFMHDIHFPQCILCIRTNTKKPSSRLKEDGGCN